MYTLINAKLLRQTLPEIVEQVQRGKKFTVLYRSQPVFDIVPANEEIEKSIHLDLSEDSLYHAKAVGSSKKGESAVNHDDILYGRI